MFVLRKSYYMYHDAMYKVVADEHICYTCSKFCIKHAYRYVRISYSWHTHSTSSWAIKCIQTVKIHFTHGLQVLQKYCWSNHGISWDCLGTSIEFSYELKIKNTNFGGKEHVQIHTLY